MKWTKSICFAAILLSAGGASRAEDWPHLDVSSDVVLAIPKLESGLPAAKRRVAVTPTEYAETNVFHTIYLPDKWTKDGPSLPIIFEYTGNHFPASGSSGEPEDAALGFGLSAGKYIWVSLPYISEDGTDNAVTWWGNEAATVAYATRNVPLILQEFNADPDAVFLCGFSRGAIAVNYLGLHDDEIAKFWTAFITHDHFDGVREWPGTTWGTPLANYRENAARRLKRVKDRPYLVIQQGSVNENENFVRTVLPGASNFTFVAVNLDASFGPFPNDLAKSSHTDRWLLRPSPDRVTTWKWVNHTAGR